MIIEFRDAVLIDGKYVLSRERMGVGESFADVWPDNALAQRLAAAVAGLDGAGVASIPDAGPPVLHICKEGAENFGHMLVEILPKLVHAAAIGIKDCRVPLPVAAVPMQALIAHTGALLGMRVEFLTCPRDAVVRVERLLWCGPVSRHDIRKSPTLLALADRLLTDIPAVSGADRLYVTRPPGSHRPIGNNAELEAFVRARGYTVVEPATLPFRDQIALFRGAKVAVGPTGAGLTHALFMPSGARIGMIDPGLCDHFFWDLACLKQQEFTWMFMGEVRRFDPQRLIAPYSIDLAALGSALDWFEDAGTSIQ